MKNVFENPIEYRKELLEYVKIPSERRIHLGGKSFICVFFTKFCSVGCPFCFFRSDSRRYGIPQEMFEFSEYGIQKFINFLNSSNNGYLLISGGGEPFEKKEYIYQTIKRAKTDMIVIVTSGIWAKELNQAEKIIFELYNSLKMRGDAAKVVLRLSVDKFHYQQLGFDVVNNIIRVFRENFINNEKFELRIHTMVDDTTVKNISFKINGCTFVATNQSCISDNDSVVKIVPRSAKLLFEDGYEIFVGMAKRFFPNLLVDLNGNVAKHSLEVFAEDMKFSEYYNSSVVTNTDKSLGLDFWINYNGNITTWGNQQLDRLNNLYVDSYAKIVEDTYNDLISYSFIDKGYNYRNEIIGEVNPKAVLRSKAINIRDYVGAVILEEPNTALYYAIRVIQDYLLEGILTDDNLIKLSDELLMAIMSDKTTLIDMYNNSSYCIFNKYMCEEFEEDKWKDLFTLVVLGHYDVTSTQIEYAIKFFNMHAENAISKIADISDIDRDEQYGRLIERITSMKLEAKTACILNNEGRR